MLAIGCPSTVTRRKDIYLAYRSVNQVAPTLHGPKFGANKVASILFRARESASGSARFRWRHPVHSVSRLPDWRATGPDEGANSHCDLLGGHWAAGLRSDRRGPPKRGASQLGR